MEDMFGSDIPQQLSLLDHAWFLWFAVPLGWVGFGIWDLSREPSRFSTRGHLLIGIVLTIFLFGWFTHSLLTLYSRICLGPIQAEPM